MKGISRAFHFAFLASLSFAPAMATTVAPMSNSEAAQQAACVLRIQVKESFQENSGIPQTLVRAEIKDIFKCSSDLALGEEILISTPGGKGLGKRQVILGLERNFKSGRDYVVFLPEVPERALTSALRVMGQTRAGSSTLWNSYEILKRDSNSDEEYVVRSGSLGIARRRSSMAMSVGHEVGRVRYEDLVSEILRGL